MKEPTIKGITIKRFRSIPVERVEFDNPTFLVGENGSGKSNFADAFSFLADAMSAPLQAVFDKKGGISTVRNRTSGRSFPPNLGFRVDFGPANGLVVGGHYSFEIRALPDYKFEVVREQSRVETAEGRVFWFDRDKKSEFASNILKDEPPVDAASLALPLIGGHRAFAAVVRMLAAMRVYSIHPTKVRELQDPDSGVILRPDGSNAASVLQEIERRSSDEAERIGELLEAVVPHTKQVRSIKHGNKVGLKFTQQWSDKKGITFESFNMSDGTLRALGLILAVYQHPSPSLVVIEEPEATIHPGAIGSILNLIRFAAKKMQVVVTTHSPEVLNAKWIEDRHLRIVAWKDGATRITGIGEMPRNALQNHLMGAGALLRSNALVPPALFDEEPGKPRQLPLFEDLK